MPKMAPTQANQADKHPEHALLGLLVSTMNGRLWDNQALTQQLLETALPVVVVDQLTDVGRGAPHAVVDAPNVRVIQARERGVSNSRNAGLKAIQADWVVLCDDDVTLLTDGLDALRQHLQRVPGNVGAVATQLMKGTDSPWRNYDPTLQVIQGRAWSAKLAIQRINSMELVLNRAHMRGAGMGFNPSFGLGAPPTTGGEEVLVLSNMLNRGWAVQVLPVATRVHPDESSGSMGNEGTAFSQGAVHRLTFDAPFRWLLLPWSLAKRLLQGSPLAQAYAYLRGWWWASRHR